MGDDRVSGLSALQERISLSIVSALDPMLGARAAERLYVVALTTDGDVMTVRLTAHTEEALAVLLADSGEGDDLDWTEYCRWWPDEWRTGDGGVPAGDAGSLVTRSRELADAKDAAHDHAQWRTHARAMLVRALGDVRVAAAITAINPGWRPVLFVTDTDGDMRPTVHSIDVLNAGHASPALVTAARAFFSGQD
ncbi:MULTISPECIES: DUF4303 domain-containing protein [unclassified Spirillospora]|uniref:DUF4303 domain-containing protein n=1 Tax=unclassified Spirillospora TaxID=2642701 RepID=UPI0037217A8F